MIRSWVPVPPLRGVDVMMVELPVELERGIFELSARTSSGVAFGLVLVARRVHAWIYPILYETVTLYERKTAVLFLSSTELKPSLTSYVKTLHIHPNVGYWEARRVLSQCTTLRNLACWVSEPRLRPFLACQRLERLSFILSGLSYATEDNTPDFSSPFYNQTTHLHLTDSWVRWVTWSGFNHIPKLTHVAFLYDDTSLKDDERVVRALWDILGCCTSLELCVLFHTHPLSSVFGHLDDNRFVAMPVPWDDTGSSRSFLNQSLDVWTAAEKEKNRARERETTDAGDRY